MVKSSRSKDCYFDFLKRFEVHINPWPSIMWQTKYGNNKTVSLHTWLIQLQEFRDTLMVFFAFAIPQKILKPVII